MKIYHNEIDAKACDVLRRNFPDTVVDERSIKDVKEEELEGYDQCHFFAGIGGFSLGFSGTSVNVWTGGFPCQDLSIAGERKGLAGERSGLYFEFHRLVVGCKPRWVVIENVPGLLSSNEGKDFAIVVGGLTGVLPQVPPDGWGNAGFFRGPVYSVAYRVLDAQFFGVPQRRRRVFIVASLRDGGCAEVLFEREGVSGDTPQGGKAGEEIAGPLGGGAKNRGWRNDLDNHGAYIAQCVMAHGQANAEIGENLSPSLTINHEAPILWEMSHANEGVRENGGVAPTLQARMGTGGNQVPMVGIRRLTPIETERLQGFPDNWTDGQSDSSRYRQTGNAVAEPVIRWMAKRMQMIDKLS